MKKHLIALFIILMQFALLNAEDLGRIIDLTRGRMWFSFAYHGMNGKTRPGGKIYKRDYPGIAFSPNRTFYYQTLPVHEGIWVSADVDGNPEMRLFMYGWRPEMIVKNDDHQLLENLNCLDPTGIKAEQEARGYYHWSRFGIDVEWRAMAWSFPDYDDFIIREYYITNTGGKQLTQFRFGRQSEVQIGNTSELSGRQQPQYDDDTYEWFDPAKYPGEATKIDFPFFYFRDNIQRDPVTYEPVAHPFGARTDLGEPADLDFPNSVNHDLRAPQYLTILWLDTPDEFKTALVDGEPEPNHLNIIQKVNTRVPERVENIWQGDNEGYDDHLRWVMSNDNPLPLHFEDDAEKERNPIDGGVAYIYEDHALDVVTSTGPYDLKPGESLKFVMVDVGGHLPIEKMMEGGKKMAKQKVLKEGRVHMVRNIEKAMELYANNYNAPKPPPTPTNGYNSLTITPIVDGIKVQWPEIDDFTDPDYNVNDLAGYRIYRSNQSCIGPWTQIAEITIDDLELLRSDGSAMDAILVFEDGMLTIYDMDSAVDYSTPNWYCVTSFDTGHDSPWVWNPADYPTLPSLESGKVNANIDPIYKNYPQVNDLDLVRVYPNPFKIHSGIPGQDTQFKMDFVNIPAHCIIRIYTLAGQEVVKLEHNDGSSNQEWNSTYHADLGIYVAQGRMVNSNWQRIVPGIYIFHVESLMPGYEGDSKIGKFVVIR